MIELSVDAIGDNVLPERILRTRGLAQGRGTSVLLVRRLLVRALGKARKMLLERGVGWKCRRGMKHPVLSYADNIFLSVKNLDELVWAVSVVNECLLPFG